MDVLKNILAEIKEAARTKQLKALSMQTRIVLGLVSLILLCIIVGTTMVGDGKGVLQNQMNEGFKKTQEEGKDGKKDGYQAQKIDDKDVERIKAEAKKKEGANGDKKAIGQDVVPPPANNPFVSEDSKKNKSEIDIPDLSGSNVSQQQQEEAIKELAKKQKPKDMIAFLKEAQSKFNFLKTQKRFKYDMKNYQVGDIFLWWKIEEITPIYIRFRDDDYAYNLRFLEEEELQ